MIEDYVLFGVFATGAGWFLASAVEIGGAWRWVLAVYLTAAAVSAWYGTRKS